MKTTQFLTHQMILLINLLLLTPVLAKTPLPEMLLYFDREREPWGMTALNPQTDEKLYLPIYTELENIETSGDGRIAYVQENDVWVLDVLNAPNEPIQVTQTPNDAEWFLAWTPDGNFLQFQTRLDDSLNQLYLYNGSEVLLVNSGQHVARHWNEAGWYVAFEDDNSTWYVWNRQETLPLEFPPLEGDVLWQNFLWTADNQLFITFGYDEQDYMQPIGRTQVFYWDGAAVHEVARPSTGETFMLGEWSNEGRLTLYTKNEGDAERWIIWDAVSFTSAGAPDVSSARAINSPTEYISDIDWLPDGRLAISMRADAEADTLFGHPFSCANPCEAQVYLWDEENLVQLTEQGYQNFAVNVHPSGMIAATRHNGIFGYSMDVYNQNLELIFQTGGIYFASRWGANGSLAYCDGNSIFVWDGQNTVQLGMGYSKWLISPAYSMLCSTG